MLFPRVQPLSGSCLLVLIAGAMGSGCASEEIPNYGDPARVAGGVGGGGGDGGGTSTSGVGGACAVDSGCAVSFKDDLFPVLDGTSKCADALCHAVGAGDLTLVPGDAANYFTALTKYKLGTAQYIVPCHPEQSKFPCNLKVSDGANPYDACGNGMPIAAANAPTLAQLTAIEDWITCGAPNN